MKVAFNTWFIAALIAFTSCSNNDEAAPKPVSNSENKIMPLGASRVEGNRPSYESFRYELWKDLIENGWTFDFIGTQSDDASYPSFNGLSFDKDHEGRGGWTSGQIADNIDSWLAETGAPDIVLFSSPGGNDALQNLPYDQAILNIKGIISALQNVNPNITIVIEQLAPTRSDAMTTELTTYFNQLKQDIPAIASEYTTSSSEVLIVDMYTGFADSLLADEVHYNEAGAEFIASRYYTVLQSVLQD
jgi:lysophospholipase L1-like esterase